MAISLPQTPSLWINIMMSSKKYLVDREQLQAGGFPYLKAALVNLFTDRNAVYEEITHEDLAKLLLVAGIQLTPKQFEEVLDLATSKSVKKRSFDYKPFYVNLTNVAQYIYKHREEVHFNGRGKQDGSVRLPSIKRRKVVEELKPLIETFELIEQTRKDSGLIPVDLRLKSESSDADGIELPYKHIPYDPELAELNRKISKMKVHAEDLIKGLVESAKTNGRLRRELEEGIIKFQKHRIQANQKIGREGALAARKRLLLRRKEQQQQVKNNLTLLYSSSREYQRAERVVSLLGMKHSKEYPVY